MAGDTKAKNIALLGFLLGIGCGDALQYHIVDLKNPRFGLRTQRSRGILVTILIEIPLTKSCRTYPESLKLQEDKAGQGASGRHRKNACGRDHERNQGLRSSSWSWYPSRGIGMRGCWSDCWIEGTKTMYARPLFKPVTDSMRRNPTTDASLNRFQAHLFGQILRQTRHPSTLEGLRTTIQDDTPKLEH